MKIAVAFHSALLTALLCAPTASLGQFAQGQAFSGGLPLAAMEGAASASSNAPDSSLYAEGTRAINQGHWADAVKLFTQAASLKSDHADGALYWKAYAEGRQGQAKPALETCQELRSNFPKSRWMEECGALEIEIHAKIGKPVQPKAGQSDELKLLALSFLMQKDESRAMAEIQDILNSDASKKLKDGALFILGQHHSDETFAQIVRLSEVEGDVRITRGADAEKTTGAVWEKAVAGLPLETGFSLVTGTGRAEIEFENASTLYLGENSVLSLNDLHTTGGVPFTELALLSGTVSLDVRPYVAGEWFILRTPTSNNAIKYPERAHFRLTSYMDAVAITPLENGLLKLAGSEQQTMVNGQTLFYREGKRIDPVGPSDPGAFAAWDKWVANRISERNTAMAQVMKQSGLKTPIPGLADLKDKGRFFDCPPYGTCFEPTASNDQQQQGITLAASQSSTDVAAVKSAQSVRTIAPARSGVSSVGGYFPCMASVMQYRFAKDGNLSPREYANAYDWALCHSGSWIPQQYQDGVQQQARYVWVPDPRRHHLPPVHWIKAGHEVAFVPIHPYDVKGRTPVNSKAQVFEVNNKRSLSVEPVKVDSGRPIHLLNAPPREFRAAFVPSLSRADAPHIEAHLLKDGSGAKSSLAKGGGGIPLSFDHKSQTFGMVGVSDHGSGVRPTFAPVNNRGGNLQARPGGFSGGGGYSAGNGYSAGTGFHGGGGYSGGASHASSGASHASGGGSSVSSAHSVSSAPSSSAGSSTPSSAAHQ